MLPLRIPFFPASALALVTSMACFGPGDDGRAASGSSAGPPSAGPGSSAGPGDEKSPAVVINEVFYHPPLDREKLQYVEIHNHGADDVDLSGWSFARGVRFTFPGGTKLPPGGHVVVCRDLSAFRGVYGEEIAALGDFDGKLSHRSDRLVLVDAAGEAVDSVRYEDRDGWPRGPDGYSPSLERISPTGPSSKPENWAASRLPEAMTPGGTPGRRNDAYSANLPPVVSRVKHSPRCPKPRREVSVSAEVHDDDGVASVELLYTVATSGEESREVRLPMERAWGDARQGTYRAVIPGQPDRRLVRFRIRARDAARAERTEPSGNEPCRTFTYFTYQNDENASVPLGFIINVSAAKRASRSRRGFGRFFGARRSADVEAPRGGSAFIYVPAGGNEYSTFDHVRVPVRGAGGFKVRFHKGKTLRGMSVVNLIVEESPRFLLAEPLAYELYRLAGVPAELTEHVRLHADGKFLGYHLLVEQPNQSFLRRNGRDTGGNLYKLLWYGGGLEGKHEKKTNTTSPRGHADLVAAVEGLNAREGEEQWKFIEKHFHVEEFVNYFAVNMCISNWDGFFNNYFVYHDTGGTGKWEIYPWDEDKTWGDYDGAPADYAFYDMPLTFGMDRSRPARSRGRRGFGFGGGWWRPPGYFSGPLLANPEFRKRFLARLRAICDTIFTEERFFPIIDALERRLEPEVRLTAETLGGDPEAAVKFFKGNMESFRRHVVERRKFILAQPEIRGE